MILITGSGGQLSKAIFKLTKLSKYKFFFKTKKQLNICNENLLRNFLVTYKIKIVINTAAITNVDWCEHNIKKTMEVNSLAVRKIANLCNRLSILFIHISTDYVYYGNSSYSYNEKSKAIPKNIYGLSKLKADNYILKYSKKYYIIRSGWIFSRNSKNFIKFIDDSLASNDSVKLIKDQIGNPTSANSLAEIINLLINKYYSDNPVKFGLYNFCNYPKSSWLGFGSYYIKNILKQDNKKIKSINLMSLNLPAKRPRNTSLSNKKIIKYLKIKKYKWKKELECY